jgi:hypothetical protein
VSIITIVSTVLGVISKQPFCHSAARVPETRLLPAAERDCHYHYQYLVQFQLVPPETLKTRLSLFRARSPSHPSCLSSKMQQNQRGRGWPTTARTLGPRIRRDQCHSFIGKQPKMGDSKSIEMDCQFSAAIVVPTRQRQCIGPWPWLLGTFSLALDTATTC